MARETLALRESVENKNIEKKGSKLNKEQQTRIDEIAAQLQSLMETGKKEKLWKELFELLRRRIEVVIGNFYKEHQSLFKARPYLAVQWENDLEELQTSRAYEVMENALAHWDKNAREAEGVEAASFSSFFTTYYNNHLKSRWLQFYMTDMRDESGRVVPKMRTEDGDEKEIEFVDKSKDVQQTIADKIASEKMMKIVEEMYKKSEISFMELYILVTRYGLGKEWLVDVVGEIKNEKQKELISSVLERGEEMTLEEVGNLLGYSRERIRQLEKKAQLKIGAKLKIENNK